MEHFDEKLAKIEEQIRQAERKKQQREDNKNQQAEQQPEPLTVEQVIDFIYKGHLELGELKIDFEETSFFEGKLTMQFPKKFYKPNSDKNGVLTLINEEHSANVILTYVNSPENTTIKNRRTGIEQVMKNSQLSTIWVEEGIKRCGDRNIEYFIFKNPIAGGVVSNIILYIPMEAAVLTINFNGNAQQLKQWTLIAKALMTTIEC